MILNTLKNIYNYIIDIFFPKKCIACGEITEFGEDICILCKRKLSYINIDKRCKECGKEKDDCDCKQYVHRYCELVSVFKYEGVARQAMLRYKHSYKHSAAEFFAQFMSKYIMEVYGDICFDAICYVPSDLRSEMRRGFTPSKAIAERLSKMLMVPLFDSLFVAEKRASQHIHSNRDKRFINARGKYACDEVLTDKTILLIDDVVTTGATLDDCTRALLFAGANKVYCATALITVPEYKNLEKQQN